MSRRNYHDQEKSLWINVESKIRAVDQFLMNNPELSKDGVFEQFWCLQNEAARAIAALTERETDERKR